MYLYLIAILYFQSVFTMPFTNNPTCTTATSFPNDPTAKLIKSLLLVLARTCLNVGLAPAIGCASAETVPVGGSYR